MVKHLGDRQGFFDGGRVGMGRDFGFSGSIVSAPTVGPKRVAEPMVAGQDFAKGGKVPKFESGGSVNSGTLHAQTPYAKGGKARYASGGHVDRVDTPDDPESAYTIYTPTRVRRLEAEPERRKLEPDPVRRSLEPAPERKPLGDEQKYARGGKTRLPATMRPAIAKKHSPVETPPRNPNQTTTPRNRMSGGVMPYGVEPSSEPMVAGSTQDIPQLRSGGPVRDKGNVRMAAFSRSFK